jgi:hypothetical protein
MSRHRSSRRNMRRDWPDGIAQISPRRTSKGC